MLAALILAVRGIYGVVSFSLGQRMREIRASGRKTSRPAAHLRRALREGRDAVGELRQRLGHASIQMTMRYAVYQPPMVSTHHDRALAGADGRGYDISPDGQRFITSIRVSSTPDANTTFYIVTNWFTELLERTGGG